MNMSVAIRGKVLLRDEETINPNIATGTIEVRATDLKILSAAKTPPFYIEDGVNVREELRLKYRYLDLGRPEMQAKMKMRHQVMQLVHNYFSENGFWKLKLNACQKVRRRERVSIWCQAVFSRISSMRCRSLPDV